MTILVLVAMSLQIAKDMQCTVLYVAKDLTISGLLFERNSLIIILLSRVILTIGFVVCIF